MAYWVARHLKEFDGFRAFDPLEEPDETCHWHGPFNSAPCWLRSQALVALEGVDRDELERLTDHILSVFATNWPALILKRWPDCDGKRKYLRIGSPASVLAWCDRWCAPHSREAHYAALVLMLVELAYRRATIKVEVPYPVPDALKDVLAAIGFGAGPFPDSVGADRALVFVHDADVLSKGPHKKVDRKWLPLDPLL